jgi:hypothetical protein
LGFRPGLRNRGRVHRRALRPKPRTQHPGTQIEPYPHCPPVC